MKRQLKFSIAALMCATAVISFLLAKHAVPGHGLEEYLGIWKIESCIDNSGYHVVGGGPVLIDTQGCEFVLKSDRLFHVSMMGTTGYEITGFELGPETKVSLKGLNTGLDSHMILKRQGSELVFAYVDQTVTNIDQTATSKQTIYTASR